MMMPIPRQPSPPSDAMLDAIKHGQVIVDRGVIIVKKIKFAGIDAVVKYGVDVRLAEAEAMDFVRSHLPTVPIPRVLAVCQIRKGTDQKPLLTTFIVSEWIPAENLEMVWDQLTDQDKDDVFEQLRGFVQSLRQLRPPSDAYYVGAASRMPCTDPMVWDRGPFNDIPSFNAALTDLARSHFRWNWLSIVERSLARTNGYRIVFTHGDLHISNILVGPRSSPTSTANAGDDSRTPRSSTTGWKIVALLDWECAGWYPEHWEYVKILSSVKWRSDWAARAQHLLDRHYDEEFLMDNRMRLPLVI